MPYKVNNIGNYKNIYKYVESKLSKFDNMDKNYDSMFLLMFSEKSNILYEKMENGLIKKTTYGEAYDDCIRFGNNIKETFIDSPQNSVVGIHLENSLNWIVIFWAVLLAGFRPLLMNMSLDIDTLEYSLSESHAVGVISDTKKFSIPSYTIKDISLLTGRAENRPCGSEIFVMSSGTSDHIKICAYSANEFYYQIHDSYDIIRKCDMMKKHYHGELKLLTFLPFYHIFGLSAVYIWFAFFSRTFVNLNDMKPYTILNTIKQHKVTHIFAVPLFWNTVYNQATEEIKKRGAKTFSKYEKGMKATGLIGDIPVIGSIFSKIAFKEVRNNLFGESISMMITGGSEISPAVLSFFNSIGYRLADGYGMSEIGVTSVELSNKKKILDACFVGRPLSSVEYQINGSGELLVKGKSISKYIIEDGKISKIDGWFNTHDLAESVNGDYRILGRKDDIVIGSSGENLNPNMIEQKISNDKADSVCLINADDGNNKCPLLLVSVDENIDSDMLSDLKSEIRKRLKENNLVYQIKKIVFTSDRLLSESDFKLNRSKISKRYSKGEFTIIDPYKMKHFENTNDALFESLKELFFQTLNMPIDDIHPDSDFFLDCGGSSLEYFVLISKIKEKFNISFPSDEDSGLITLNDFYNYVKGKNKNAD